MECGRMYSKEGVPHTENMLQSQPSLRTKRKHTLSLLLCLFAVGIPQVLSINFLRTESSRRRPRHRTSTNHAHRESSKLTDESNTGKPLFHFSFAFPWSSILSPRNEAFQLLAAIASEATAHVHSHAPSSSEMDNKLPTPTQSPESVHLQLQELAHADSANPEDQTDQVPQPPNSNKNKQTTVKIHTYLDPTSGSTWKALNTAKGKFHAFLQHQQVSILSKNDIVTEEMVLSDNNNKNDPDSESKMQSVRQEWRDLWKKRQLLTDRTELLAVYPSDKTEKDNIDKSKAPAKTRRGGFTDLLFLYTERLLAILRDEHDERHGALPGFTSVVTNGDNDSMLVSWLKENYGTEPTEQLQASNLNRLPEKEQLGQLKHFLEWFRSQFPYYYDRCGSCGASMKEDHIRCPPTPEDKADKLDGDGKDHQEQQTFVGYIYPDDAELNGKASRTEIYHCHKCQSFTRFPRFNSVSHVIEQRRGRCGEYSMLLFRILRALDHEARWVVDWADHVWAEVALGGGIDTANPRWVHLDPCEAAVDENLIYEGWGKKQTFILGFYAPPRNNASKVLLTTPTIEDITASYTSDSWEEIYTRREESQEEICLSMEKAVGDLADKLTSVEDKHK